MKRILTLSLALITFVYVNAQEGNKQSGPEDIVNELYDLVSFKAGESPDWDRVRSLFLDEAVIILKTSRDSSTVFNLEGFINDFISFIENSRVKTTGFTERIIKKKAMVFGDMAHILVVYEVSIPGTEFKPQLGLDSFHLTKRKDGWKISSVLNEVPTPDKPLPEGLK
jgi:hypothetical protein